MPSSDDVVTAPMIEGAPHREALRNAMLPLIDGGRLLGVKCYYCYRTENGIIDVGVLDLSGSGSARPTLTMAVYAEAFLVHPEIAERVGFVRRQVPIIN